MQFKPMPADERFEELAERYRRELLRCQRATAPGQATLEEEKRRREERLLTEASAETEKEENTPAPEEAEPCPSCMGWQSAPQPRERPLPPDGLPDSPLLPEIVGPIEEAAKKALSAAEAESEDDSCPMPAALPSPEPQAKACGFRTVCARGGFTDQSGDTKPVSAAFVSFLPVHAPDSSRGQRAVLLSGEGGFVPFYMTRAAFSWKQNVNESFFESVLSDENGFYSPERFWEQVCRAPESLAAVRELFSDRGTPASLVGTSFFSPPLVSSDGESVVRLSLVPESETPPNTALAAEEIGSADPEALCREVYTLLTAEHRPEWTLFCQRGEASQALADPTRPWSEEKYPPTALGKITLEEFVPPRACASMGRMILEPAPFSGRGKQSDFAGAALCPEARVLAANMAAELKKLPAPLLERVLMLISQDDLAFASQLTAHFGA